MTAAMLESATPMGTFSLRPLDEDGDFDLLHTWMNDPAVARFWELDGPARRLEAHLEQQRAAGHSQPHIGALDQVPMSYWEIYAVDRDRLAGYYRARPGDTGLHLLLGPAGVRGAGLGRRLIADVTAWLLNEPGNHRIVAEPDITNTPSVRAFGRAGFRWARTIELPEKTAALMIREHDTTARGDVA